MSNENNVATITVGDIDQLAATATYTEDAEAVVSPPQLHLRVRVDGFRMSSGQVPQGKLVLSCGSGANLDTLAELKAKLRKDAKILLRYSPNGNGSGTGGEFSLDLKKAVVDGWLLAVAAPQEK